MIITIIAVLLFIGALINHFLTARDKCYDNIWIVFCPYWIAISCMVLFVVCGLLGVRVATENIEYQKMQMQQEILIYRMEQLDENGSYAEVQLYNDVVEFNKIILHNRYWSNNAWTSWFNYKKIGHMETIDFESGAEE